MAEHILDIEAANGVPFRLVVTESEHATRNEPIVRIHDRRHPDYAAGSDHGQRTGGQYYLSTLLAHRYGAGLDVHGGVPEWTIDSSAMAVVHEWLRLLEIRGVAR